ncbi:hypothetical protein AGABI1DRAFT_48580 [Agaricus bisporus var. burnettii JB137-S8]|uniref:Uncharacterized protein n=1 Tax=Agaricus bisporus var. burnettii (strain JB137-S8 / ATCC MYA-4627 / FGSC 10392) TaxID=597362 RepID=K5WUB5_AGABU|nr:uncharacterized protein AGABI1DRAFT_48580 [Agaricus bisporus var. burnettii JB137-S8]EKM74122.1 hypothetical protein AGABI1DRAFT_48580 [Agaricus bisporus var. burnettii JB137-S8]
MDGSINMAPFQPPTSEYSSKPSEYWANALKNVDTRPSRNIDHPRRSMFKGYTFPSSYILCGDENKNTENVLAWLLIRTRWLSHMSGFQPRTAPLPNLHQWRSYLRDLFLEHEFLRPDTRKPLTHVGEHGKTSRTARRNARSRETAKEIFSIRTPKKGDVELLTWNDRVVWRRGQEVDFQVWDRQLVAWDVQKHNFQLELINLDRCLLADSWRSTDGAILREKKLRSVFVNEALLTVDLPRHSFGISSGSWEERRPYVEAFRNAVVDWPNVPQELLTIANNNQIDVERAESLVASFYCQTFFDYFGRAPCVPHLFPLKD